MKKYELKEIFDWDLCDKYEGYFLGDPIVPSSLEDYTFPTFASFFGEILLDDGLWLYIFFDLESFYSGEFGSKAIKPIGYLSYNKPSIYFDDFNEAHDEEIPEFKKCFGLVLGSDEVLINNDSIIINNINKDFFEFFLNFEDDIKYVQIDFSIDKLDSFVELEMNFIK